MISHAGTRNLEAARVAGVACGVVAALVTTLGPLGSASAQEQPLATVEGGADVTGHNYTWTVTNQHSSPIVAVEIPHYRADLFFGPDGWSTAESTYLVNVGVKDRPGVCKAQAPSKTAGIPRGRSAQFKARINARGAKRGRAEVVVEYADGTRVTVANVEVPRAETLGEKHTLKIGFGVMFALFLGAQAIRHRKRNREGEAAEIEDQQAASSDPS